MNSTDFEIFYNWNNSLKTNEKIQYKNIESKVKSMQSSGHYSNSEIEEILVADGHQHKLVLAALNSDKQTKTSSSTKLSSVPKSYSDLSDKIENALTKYGPSKFVNLLTSGSNPLMKINKEGKDTLQKLADSAYDNKIHLASLHAFIKPSIVSELAENVCKARKIASKCNIIKSENNVTQISYNGKIINASFSPVYSSNEKFSSSNYDKFEFPDEFVIYAYEQNSPYAKLAKDLV